MGEPKEPKTPALVKILGTAASPVAYKIRDFLHRSDVPFEWVLLATDEEARSQAQVEFLPVFA